MTWVIDIVVTYIMLFLFTFTFAFAFTMEAKADHGAPCCIISMCPPPDEEVVQEWGHIVILPKGGAVCVNPGGDPCDWTYNCGPVS